MALATSSATSSRWRLRGDGFVVYVRSLLVLVLVWHGLALWIGNPVMLPQPASVVFELYRLVASGELLAHALVSVWRLVLSFLLAGLIGIPLGICMGLSATAHDLLDPLIELLRPISGIAWIPLALFIFGIGNQLPIFIITYVALFPFVLNTVAGVAATDRTLVRAARTMGLDQATIVRQVVLPSALPQILTGARIAGGAAWMSLVAAELIGAPSGLGFAIEWYRQLLMTAKVIAVILAISLLGYLTDRLLRELQRRLTPWATGIGAAP